MREISESVLKEIRKLLCEKESVIVAIDGRCASGKTTLASLLGSTVDCNIVHADSFFLLPHQRTEERLSVPGENIEHERLLSEVLIPLKSGEPFSYRPFDCSTMDFKEDVFIIPKKINIIEGSYCCHHSLLSFYDLTVFLSTDKEKQLQRILERNGEASKKIFENKWIPLEEAYFEKYKLKDNTDLSFKT